jgi:hypothetical protein
MIRKLLRRSGLALLLVSGGLLAVDLLTFDRQAWLDDYEQLKTDLATGYANLDWMVSARRMDLPALDRHTRDRLESAHSHIQAVLALRDFLRAFRDPHLKLVWGERPALSVTRSNWHRPAADSGLQSDGDASADVQALATVSDCRAAGYETANTTFELPFAALPGWQALESAPFTAGISGDLGVLRIAAFGEDRYLGQCEQAFVAGLDARALQLRVRAALQHSLEQTLQTLQQAGARRLLIDLSGNGGGTEWVSEVIVLFAQRPLQRTEAVGVDAPCDRRGIWRGETVCPALATERSVATLDGRGLWRGEVLILADHRTGSAAEDFLVWLQGNGVARVIGERSAGAGCGYVNGGHRSVMKASRFDVRMPNCARLFADGRNEVEGVQPDLPLQISDRKGEETIAELRTLLGR